MIRINHRNLRILQNPSVYLRTYSNTASEIKDQKVHSEDPKPFSEIPVAKGVPVFGTIAEWASNPQKIHELMKSRVETYGTIFREKVGIGLHSDKVMTANPDDWSLILRSDMKGGTPERDGMWPVDAYNKKYGYPKSLIDLYGEEYARLKDSVRSMRIPKEVGKLTPLLSEVTDDLMKLLSVNIKDDSNVIESIRQFIHLWTFECGGAMVFRTRFGLLQEDQQSRDKDMIKMFDAAQAFFNGLFVFMTGFPHHRTMKTKEWYAFESANNTINEIGKRLYEKHGEYTTDPKSDLSERERCGMALDILKASSDTTAHTALWTLIVLSENPEIQEKLYDEITRVYTGGQLTHSHLQVPYLRGFLREVFRTKPIIAILSRITQQDYILSGYHVPAGSAVLFLLEAYDQSKWFEHPMEVKPERWARGANLDAKNTAFTSLPFGYGERACLGRRLAENELYIFILKLVMNFKLHQVKKYDSRYALFLTPEGDVSIRLEARK